MVDASTRVEVDCVTVAVETGLSIVEANLLVYIRNPEGMAETLVCEVLIDTVVAIVVPAPPTDKLYKSSKNAEVSL